MDATPYTDEQAQDAVGTILTEGPTVEWIYDDALPGILAQVKTQRSILYDANGLMLNGDVLTPGNTMLYGTNGSGTKGWYAQPAASVPSYTEGTFTVTATGMATTVTGTARYVQIGKQVTVLLPGLTGTSNATTFTVTGLPAGLIPGANHLCWAYVADAGTSLDGTLIVESTGIMTLYKPNFGAFTASGTKTLYGSLPLTYLLP